ncbi:MAG: SBBP repeat-containing protein, partial [Promethearchaeota archaeon]
EWGIQATRELLEMGSPPTAIFAGSNRILTGTMIVLAERGLRVPDDISVIAFDDSEWLSFWQPPITTVDIAVDEIGNAVVVGETNSTDFPTMAAYDSSYNGAPDYYGWVEGADCFILKLNALGDALVYSSYLGGSEHDQMAGVAIDSDGYACITGETWSPDFPLVDAYDWIMGGEEDIFVAKFNPYGIMTYSTFFGGSDVHGRTAREWPSDIAVDNEGNMYVVGNTEASDFPEGNYLDGEPGYDAIKVFIFKLTSRGDDLVYSSLFGSDVYFPPSTVVVSPTRNPYIIGDTWDENFPLVNSMKTAPESSDCYVVRLSEDGQTIELSTLIGGTESDYTTSATMDKDSNVIVCGYTRSSDFPTENAVDSSINSVFDAFVFRINSAGDEITYSTFLGGEDDDFAYSVAVDSHGYPHVVGSTYSLGFPAINALNDTHIGGRDGFLTILTTPEDWDGDHLTDAEETEQGTSSSNPDSDSDSIPDGFEVEFGLNPLVNDASDDDDSDGLSNLAEVWAMSDPFSSDSDGDSLSDLAEINIHGSLPYLADSDHDLLDDDVEINDVGTDVMRFDTDFDLMGDGFEYLNSLDPFTNDSMDDFDGDGLSNLEEFFYNGDPDSLDGDGDGIDDYLEVLVYGTNPGLADTDGDSLSDGEEINTYNSDPLSVDGDGDGLRDDWEVQNGFDPAEYTRFTGESAVHAAFTAAIAFGLAAPVMLLLEVLVRRGKVPKLRRIRFLFPAIVFLIAILLFAPADVMGNGDPGSNRIETTSKDFRYKVYDASFYDNTIRVECSYYMVYFETTSVTVIFYMEGVEQGRISLTIRSTAVTQKTEYASGSLELDPGVYNVRVVVGRSMHTELSQARAEPIGDEQSVWTQYKFGFFSLGALMVVGAVMFARKTPDVQPTPVVMEFADAY